MLRARIVWGWVFSAWVLAAPLGSGCSGTGGPATSPINPFGSDPVVVSGSEPAGSGTDKPPTATIEQLCTSACANIQAMCPGAEGGTDCAAQCATTDTMGCQTQFNAFVACLATATLDCTGGGVSATACQAEEQAIGTCINPAGTTMP
jgi:hypothetical protein